MLPVQPISTDSLEQRIMPCASTQECRLWPTSAPAAHASLPISLSNHATCAWHGMAWQALLNHPSPQKMIRVARWALMAVGIRWEEQQAEEGTCFRGLKE